MELIKYGIFAAVFIVVFFKVYEFARKKMGKTNEENDPVLSTKIFDDADFK